MIEDSCFHLHNYTWRTHFLAGESGSKAASTTAVIDKRAEAIVSAIEERAAEKAANEAESEAVVQ